MSDHSRACPRLACPWRPLDEKIARVQSQGAGFDSAHINRVELFACSQAPNLRALAFEHRFECRVAVLVLVNRLGKAEKRHSLIVITVWTARNERFGKRRSGQLGTTQ